MGRMEMHGNCRRIAPAPSFRRPVREGNTRTPCSRATHPRTSGRARPHVHVLGRRTRSGLSSQRRTLPVRQALSHKHLPHKWICGPLLASGPARGHRHRTHPPQSPPPRTPLHASFGTCRRRPSDGCHTALEREGDALQTPPPPSRSTCASPPSPSPTKARSRHATCATEASPAGCTTAWSRTSSSRGIICTHRSPSEAHTPLPPHDIRLSTLRTYVSAMRKDVRLLIGDMYVCRYVRCTCPDSGHVRLTASEIRISAPSTDVSHHLRHTYDGRHKKSIPPVTIVWCRGNAPTSPRGRLIYFFEKRSSSLASMSRVMPSRSYSGFQSHSSRAQVSSSELGHDSAMLWRSGST